MVAAKRIGILTSGGDCAGLNSVIRAVVHRAGAEGWEVLGIRNGTAGLLARPVEYTSLDRGAVGNDPQGALSRTARGLGICFGD